MRCLRVPEQLDGPFAIRIIHSPSKPDMPLPRSFLNEPEICQTLHPCARARGKTEVQAQKKARPA